MKFGKIEIEKIVVGTMHEVAPKGGQNALRSVLKDFARSHGPIVVAQRQSHGPIVVSKSVRTPATAFLKDWEKIHGPIVVGSVLTTKDQRTEYVCKLGERLGVTSKVKVSSEASLAELADVVCAKLRAK
jgi:hypothetical protein